MDCLLNLFILLALVHISSSRSLEGDRPTDSTGLSPYSKKLKRQVPFGNGDDFVFDSFTVSPSRVRSGALNPSGRFNKPPGFFNGPPGSFNGPPGPFNPPGSFNGASGPFRTPGSFGPSAQFGGFNGQNRQFERPDGFNGQNGQFNSQNARETETTTPQIPGMGTTRSPCEDACQTTPQYNPVCGDDNMTYFSQARLTCAQRCGKTVRLLHMGACTVKLRIA